MINYATIDQNLVDLGMRNRFPYLHRRRERRDQLRCGRRRRNSAAETNPHSSEVFFRPIRRPLPPPLSEPLQSFSNQSHCSIVRRVSSPEQVATACLPECSASHSKVEDLPKRRQDCGSAFLSLWVKWLNTYGHGRVSVFIVLQNGAISCSCRL